MVSFRRWIKWIGLSKTFRRIIKQENRSEPKGRSISRWKSKQRGSKESWLSRKSRLSNWREQIKIISGGSWTSFKQRSSNNSRSSKARRSRLLRRISKSRRIKQRGSSEIRIRKWGEQIKNITCGFWTSYKWRSSWFIRWIDNKKRRNIPRCSNNFRRSKLRRSRLLRWISKWMINLKPLKPERSSTLRWMSEPRWGKRIMTLNVSILMTQQ